jgi:segregation and condensation protein A
MQRMYDRNNKPQHVVYKYRHTMEEVRAYMLATLEAERVMSFEKVFEVSEDRIHAIFLFLTILELAQQRWMTIMVGEGPNNFIVTWNDEREADTDVAPDVAASSEDDVS